MRCARTRVLPDPAPAMTRTGPAGSVTASYWAGFNPERVFAAGMMPHGVLRHDFAYEHIDANTEIYGVMGDPIEQSLSPAIHNTAFRHLGLNKVMVPFLVPSGELNNFFNELLWLELKGCSVTKRTLIR